MPEHSHLRYTFSALRGGAQFDVIAFSLNEGLSQVFELQVQLASHEDDIGFSDLLDQPVLFTILHNDRPTRYVHGLVSRFSQAESGLARTYYHARVEPQLARASLRSNWRIFQHKSVPQILELMLKRQGITQFELTTSVAHQPREFCVQAGETDLAFITRLAAEEGFVYRFEHTPSHHKLLITDRLLSMGTIKAEETDAEREQNTAYDVLYLAIPDGPSDVPCLRRLNYSEQVRSTRQVQRDYTFLRPAYRQEHVGVPHLSQWHRNEYERFDYPGRYNRDVVGKAFVNTRAAALQHDARTACVEGDDVRVQPGIGFNLTGHPRQSLNTHWRAISVTHEGSQYACLAEEAAGAERGSHYQQSAVLVPGMAEWRPAPLPKPHIDGPQIATVVGPPGEEIYCDEWGRVKVSFPWDRESRDDAFSSCWVRVSQGWAGGSWGSMAIPRIGQEVIVQFLNADPDQPVITGRTYCANQLPPYDLPEHKTRMTIKSQTHKGEGFNELRFEDELGREEVFVHAQKDHNTQVRHDQSSSIGRNRNEQIGQDEARNIGRNRSDKVGNDVHVSVGQDARLEVGRNRTVNIANDHVLVTGNNRQETIVADYHISIGANLEQQVQGRAELEAGALIGRRTQRYELRAAQTVTIQGPGGSIRIDETGITLEGLLVRINGELLVTAAAGSNPLPMPSAPGAATPLQRQCGRQPDGSCALADCRCMAGPSE
ncbi:type VI secretion system Vgr family protein [Pseudomonas farsensis]|uniref:Type VI secretion system tip protein TssI/VgrG n=1 Tax=Pseudomonas farsensis TaxID=2745492 RepID=A0ABU8QMR4_9PSED